MHKAVYIAGSVFSIIDHIGVLEDIHIENEVQSRRLSLIVFIDPEIEKFFQRNMVFDTSQLLGRIFSEKRMQEVLDAL